MAQGRFNFRSFTSFILTWTFLTLMVSGAVLYIAPPGRIANWTGWQLILLAKEQWQAVHTLAAILFLTGGLFHLLKYNWKPFIAYMRSRAEAKQPVRMELLASLAIFLLVIGGTIAQLAPFQSVMNLGTSIRESWEPADSNPPIPHMEQMAVTQLSDNLKVETPQLMGSLDQLGLKPADKDERLEDLAKRHGQSPEQVYKALKNQLGSASGNESDHATASEAGENPGRGRRQGLRSLAELAGEYGLSPEAAVQKLAAKGISAAPQDTMRDIANRNGKRPYEVLEILRENPK